MKIDYHSLREGFKQELKKFGITNERGLCIMAQGLIEQVYKEANK